MGIIKFFAERSFFAVMVSVLTIILGGFTLSGMKLQEFPNMEIPMTIVTTSVNSAASSDIENGVTNRLEDELKSVSGLKYISSTSKEGLSKIQIRIEDDEILDDVNSDIEDAVDRANDILDNEIPYVGAINTKLFSVMKFGLYSETATVSELQTYGRVLEQKIRQLRTVSSVSVHGLREREFIVNLNQDTIKTFGLEFNSISDKIAKINIERSGGLVSDNGTDKRILTYSKIDTVDKLGQIIVGIHENGTQIKLKDISTISDTFEKKVSSSYIGEHLGLSFDVNKSSSADIRQVIQDVKDLLEKETESFNGVYQFEYGMDLSEDMSERFSIVINNGLMGLFLVICILSLSLRKSISFWVAVSIPFCVLGVIALLPFFDISLDTITLAALLLVIGIIVDDSVVVAESISQYRAKGYSPIDSSVAGVKDVFKPLIASLTTTCLVFIPMLSLSGGLGRFIFVIPVVVILSLLLSMIDCFILLPAHIKNVKAKDEVDNFKKIKKIYIGFLNKIIDNKWKVIVSSLVVTCATLALITLLKIDFFPTGDAKYLRIRVIAPNGSEIQTVENFNIDIVKLIKEKTGDDLESVFIDNGTPTSGGSIMLSNAGEREITAEEYAKMYRGLSKDGFKVMIRVDGGAGPPKGEAVDIRIISGNDEKREEAILEVVEFLEGFDYIRGIESSDDIKNNQIQITPNYEWIERYDYSVQELSAILRYTLDGKISSSVWIGDDEVDIRIQLNDQARSLQSLKTMEIKMPNGDLVQLGKLATISEQSVVSELKHWNGQRYVNITADISDENISVIDFSELINQQFKDDLDVSYEIGGQAEDTKETLNEIITAFAVAVVGMFFVLAILLNSLIQPLLILAILPYAFGGAILAVFLHGADLSLFGLIGLLGMFGVVVNNSLVLINKANELRDNGQDKRTAIINAAENRLRPIILTSLTTIFCLLPLVYGVGGKDAYMSPMSMTLGYGLLLTIPIVLFVIPCFYLVVTKENKAK